MHCQENNLGNPETQTIQGIETILLEHPDMQERADISRPIHGPRLSTAVS